MMTPRQCLCLAFLFMGQVSTFGIHVLLRDQYWVAIISYLRYDRINGPVWSKELHYFANTTEGGAIVRGCALGHDAGCIQVRRPTLRELWRDDWKL